MYTSGLTDPLRPVICLDETNRQLVEKRNIPAKPGSLEREDYEHRRCSVMDLFVAFEPVGLQEGRETYTYQNCGRFCPFSP